jgi:hypothetical protein
VNQLLSDEWSVGVHYRLSRAELDRDYPQIPAGAQEFGGFQAHQNLEATLNQVYLFALFNHPSGFFAGANAIWTAQSNDGYTPNRPGDDFWQFNLEAGWRFARRRVEVGVALLNLADQDYKLNPLNLTAELPRERTLAVRLRLNFDAPNAKEGRDIALRCPARVQRAECHAGSPEEFLAPLNAARTARARQPYVSQTHRAPCLHPRSATARNGDAPVQLLPV